MVPFLMFQGEPRGGDVFLIGTSWYWNPLLLVLEVGRRPCSYGSVGPELSFEQFLYCPPDSLVCAYITARSVRIFIVSNFYRLYD